MNLFTNLIIPITSYKCNQLKSTRLRSGCQIQRQSTIILKVHMIRKVFPILALSLFSSTLGIGIIAPILPLFAESLGATGIWLGMIFAGFAISRAIFAPIFGRLSDRSGRKLFISTGLLAYAVISLGFIWASSVYQLTLVRLLHGVAGGMVIPIALAYVGDISPEGEEGKWMGYSNAAFFIGFGFGPLIGGVLTDHFGMTVAFATMSGLNLLAFLIALLFLPEISHRKMAAIPNPSFKKMGASSMVRGLFSFRIGRALGFGAFIPFLPILAATYMGLSLSLIGIVLATNMVLTSLFQPHLGKIADRFNKRGLVIIGSLIYSLLLASIPFAQNFWQLLGLCALTGLGSAISMPAASALTVEEGRKFGMGSTMAIFSTAFNIGMAVGPLLSGVIADLININSVFYFGASMGLVGAGLFFWFTR